MITDIAVTVPAADEEDEIGDCLSAVGNAIAELHARTAVRGHVVVALDDCGDATASIVAGFPAVQTVVCAARRVGTARRHAAAAALARWGPPERLWFASTDADCRVPVDWLTEMAAAIAGGTDLVLGTVRPAQGLTASVERAWYAAHTLDDGHVHIHGANMGMSATAYVRLGGWRDLAVHEDVDFVQRAVAADVSITRSGAAPVSTSSRMVGRAPEGFATYLKALQDGLPAVS